MKVEKIIERVIHSLVLGAQLSENLRDLPKIRVVVEILRYRDIRCGVERYFYVREELRARDEVSSFMNMITTFNNMMLMT